MLADTCCASGFIGSDAFATATPLAAGDPSDVVITLTPDRPRYSAAPNPPQVLRLEAEEMALDGYRIEPISFASNQAVASFVGGAGAEQGTVQTSFAGQTGFYDVVVGYFDEKGGKARLDPALNDQSLGAFLLDQNLDEDFATPDNFVRRTVSRQMEVNNGDIFAIAGTEDGGEHARVDYAEFSLVAAPARLMGGAGVRYITPTGTGTGSSWQQAAGIADLDRLIEQSAPGDEIWIAGDLGVYNVANQVITIDSGSTAVAPIYIRGMASTVGGVDTPFFVGDRAPNWMPGQPNGSEVFRLLEGANHLYFSGLNFENIGNGAFRLGGDLTGITIEDMQATNVRRFVENFVSGGATTASVSDLTIRDVTVSGFSKGAIRLQYDTHNVLIEDVFGDSQQQDGDNFAMGVQLAGTAHDVLHRRVTMNNAVQRRDEQLYWNADGFVTEAGTYNIVYEDTFAAGNTDGGYDLKSNNTLLRRAVASDNKRNFRIWGNTTMLDMASDEPFKRGGIGTTAHIHVLQNGNLTVRGSLFSGDRSIENIIFDLDDNGSLDLDGGIITDNLYTLQTVGQGSIALANLTEPTFSSR